MVNSFSEITQPRNCNAAPQTLNYLSTALPARMTKMYRFFNTLPRVGHFKVDIYGARMDMTPRDLFGGLVQVDGSYVSAAYHLYPPSAVDICNGYRQYLCREPKNGETFQFVVSNKSDKDVFLLQSVDSTVKFSTLNATLLINQIALVPTQRSAIFWFTIISCKPGEEKVEMFRPNFGSITAS